MRAYNPGDRVKSIIPDGETGTVIEQEEPYTLHVLWDDNTTSAVPLNFVIPQRDLPPVKESTE